MVVRHKKKYVGKAHHRLQPYPNASTQHINQEQHLSPHFNLLNLNKKLGQHLLKNPGIIEKIITAAEIKSTDIVLEIGCGTGNLTVKLLPLAKQVIAFDIDEKMVQEVKKRSLQLGYQNLNIKLGNVLQSELGFFHVCTANLPYQISSPFIFKLLTHRPLFRCAVLMFQKEFGERLCSKPGDKCYCRLAVNVQLFVQAQTVCIVKAANFNPPPKVDSIIVKLSPKQPQPEIDFKEWDGILRICFLRKRRTLHSNFTVKSVLKLLENNYTVWCEKTNNTCENSISIKERIDGLLEKLNLTKARAVNLSANDFLVLLLNFNQQGIHFINSASIRQQSDVKLSDDDEGDQLSDDDESATNYK